MVAATRFRPLEPIMGAPDIDESYIRQCDPVVLRTLQADLPRLKLEETPGFFKVVFNRKKVVK